MIFVPFFFSFIFMSQSQNCWVGTSNNDSTSGYPPTSTTCDQPDFVCQLEQTLPDNYYTLLCSKNTVCQAALSDMETNPGTLYTNVICCHNDLCNSYPGQPDTSSGVSSIHFFLRRSPIQVFLIIFLVDLLMSLFDDEEFIINNVVTTS